MRLSLVICTRNRAPQLERALEAMLRLKCDFQWELVLVDNGSSDETVDVIDAYETRLPIKSCFESHIGLGRARNRGCRAALGEIITFTDDDCYPAEDFLTAIARAFDEEQTLGFICGRVKLHDPRDLPVTIRDVDEPQLFNPREFIRAGAVHGANFAFRRTALVQARGFDDRFGAGTRFSCEDIDMVARVLASGWHGAYDPRVVVAHHHGRRTLAAVKKLNREYDRGRGAYYIKCIMNPSISSVAAKNWYWSMLSAPGDMTLRELIGGSEFLLRSFGEALGRIGSAVIPTRAIHAGSTEMGTNPRGTASSH